MDEDVDVVKAATSGLKKHELVVERGAGFSASWVSGNSAISSLRGSCGRLSSPSFTPSKPSFQRRTAPIFPDGSSLPTSLTLTPSRSLAVAVVLNSSSFPTHNINVTSTLASSNSSLRVRMGTLVRLLSLCHGCQYQSFVAIQLGSAGTRPPRIFLPGRPRCHGRGPAYASGCS